MPPASPLRRLSAAQTAAFDRDYLAGTRWEQVERWIAARHGTAPFTFVDVGGGTGLFAARVLDRFPASHGVLLEPADGLRTAVAPHPRLEVHARGAEDLGEVLGDRRVDLVAFNWVLHHLVGRTRRRSVAAAGAALTAARDALTGDGHVLICESLYDGRLIDGLPSRAIFAATSRRWLGPVARRAGANTAGVGVSYGSRRSWLALLHRSGLEVVEELVEEPQPMPRTQQRLLGTPGMRVALWLGRPS